MALLLEAYADAQTSAMSFSHALGVIVCRLIVSAVVNSDLSSNMPIQRQRLAKQPSAGVEL